MEITSVCPYCGKEMRDGAIPVLRDIYWCPRGEDGMLKDGFDSDGEILLGRAGLLGDYYTPARYCESCKVVIVPVPEIDTLADKADRWLNKTLGSLGGKIDEATERRKEEKAERKRREKREKDPWEV